MHRPPKSVNWRVMERKKMVLVRAAITMKKGSYRRIRRLWTLMVIVMLSVAVLAKITLMEVAILRLVVAVVVAVLLAPVVCYLK